MSTIWYIYHSDLVSRALLELLYEKYTVYLACSCLLLRKKSALLLLAVQLLAYCDLHRIDTDRIPPNYWNGMVHFPATQCTIIMIIIVLVRIPKEMQAEYI